MQWVVCVRTQLMQQTLSSAHASHGLTICHVEIGLQQMTHSCVRLDARRIVPATGFW